MADHTVWRDPYHRSALAATAIVGLLLLTFGSVHAATVTIAAVNFEFKPSSRTVEVGDVVRWTFTGDPHTVTSGTPGSPDGRFMSGIEDPGGSFQVTFDSVGTFPYFCEIHSEQMTGTITVTAGETPTASATRDASPTPRPTPKPTASPTARPTARPSAAPSPTEVLSELPSASPAAPPTSAPTASAAASSPSASIGPTVGVSASSEPNAAPGDDSAAAAVSPALIVVAALVVVGLVAAGLALVRRSPRI